MAESKKRGRKPLFTTLVAVHVDGPMLEAIHKILHQRQRREPLTNRSDVLRELIRDGLERQESGA